MGPLLAQTTFPEDDCSFPLLAFGEAVRGSIWEGQEGEMGGELEIGNAHCCYDS